MILLLLTLLNICQSFDQSYYPPQPFDEKIANASVYFSAAAACGQEKYPTMIVNGPTDTFKYLYTIYDKKSDTQGYIGIQSLTSKIWIVYRGTTSYTNWLDDGEIILKSIDFCDGCKIHSGFKKCYDNTIDFVLSSLQTVTKEYPTYEIVVAGHSLGGAISTLVTSRLFIENYKPLHYSFGSPRVGNQEFSDWVKKTFIGNRVTHYKDMVPHVPYESFGYHHISNEIYEDENHVLHGCKGNDDKTCAEQWAFYQTSPSDHTLYLNLAMSCANATRHD